MKQIIIGVFITCLAGLTYAQKSVTIEGSFSKDRYAEVKLFKVKDGTPHQIATSLPSAKGKFGFNFVPDYEGLYLVGTGNNIAPQGNYQFWLKPGDKLNIVLTDSSYQLVGALNSKENQVLTQWYKLAWPIEWKGIYFNKTMSTYVDFFPLLGKTLPKMDAWAKAQKLKPTGNKKFDAALQYIVNFDKAFYAINFLNTPRAAHPDPEEIPDYYSSFSLEKNFTNVAQVYAQPWGLRAFSSILMREQAVAGKRGNLKDPYSIDQALKLIPNDTLKGDYILGKLKGNKDYGKYVEQKAMYEEYLLTDAQKEEEFKINAALATLKPGDKGLDFKYEDKDGKMVSFSDLKGKVVLIDTWATWCGPCKVEIPHLKKLEEEMKGKNVHIVSISVDEEKDKEKWKKMIADENLGGLQLFASGWSEITQYYKITGIPRFLLFDKEGKIISVDAPRPSNPELKPLIEKYL